MKVPHCTGKKSSPPHWADEMCPETSKSLQGFGFSHRLVWVPALRFTALWVWTLYLIFLSLSVLIGKTGTIIKPSHQDFFFNIKWDNACKVLRRYMVHCQQSITCYLLLLLMRVVVAAVSVFTCYIGPMVEIKTRHVALAYRSFRFHLILSILYLHIYLPTYP